MKRRSGWWESNGLSLVLVAIFLCCLAGQVCSGHAAWNEDLAKEGAAPVELADYLLSGHFMGAMFENWESEFLQMGMYVILTTRLRQRGSAESRPMPGEEEPARIERGKLPGPVARGGWRRRIYAHSLSIALLALFAASMFGHALGSWSHGNAERRMIGLPPVDLWSHLGSAQFWFESMQNWQSEFLAVLSLVLLSIFLREEKSPQSKPLESPHSQTGG